MRCSTVKTINIAVRASVHSSLISLETRGLSCPPCSSSHSDGGDSVGLPKSVGDGGDGSFGSDGGVGGEAGDTG